MEMKINNTLLMRLKKISIQKICFLYAAGKDYSHVLKIHEIIYGNFDKSIFDNLTYYDLGINNHIDIDYYSLPIASRINFSNSFKRVIPVFNRKGKIKNIGIKHVLIEIKNDYVLTFKNRYIDINITQENAILINQANLHQYSIYPRSHVLALKYKVIADKNNLINKQNNLIYNQSNLF